MSTPHFGEKYKEDLRTAFDEVQSRHNVTNGQMVVALANMLNYYAEQVAAQAVVPEWKGKDE